MSKRWILAGSTDQTIDVFIQDSSSTTGAGLTGLTSATSGLTCYYRKGATGTPTALTLVSQTVTGAHADGGFVAVDGTNMPGVYRLDLSDTIVASAGMVTLFLRGAANMAQLPLEIEVVSVNPYDSAAFGLSRIDAAISSRMATYTQPTGFLGATFPTTVASPTNITAGTITTVSGNVGGNVVGSVGSVTAAVTVGTNNDKTGYSLATAPPTAGAIADAVWDEAYNQHTTAGTFGKLMDTLRKANYITEGSVAAGGTPTTTSFRTDLTEPDGTFDNQTLLFLTGVLAGESVPILTYAQSNGLITTQNALTAAPTAADEFVILPDHVHSVAEIADGVHDEAVEGAETLRQAVRLMRAALVGKLSGAATTTVTIRDAGDTKARITATVDADGNRSAVTTDAT